MKIAYQGAPGAFGWEACRAFLPEWTPVARATFAGVVKAVLAGKAARGILPLRNAIAGPVPGVEELIRESGLVVIDRHRLPIRMHLLGLADADLDQISQVMSHAVALAQCGRWIGESGMATKEASNTALAAQALADSGDATLGVIASEAAADAYGLKILRRDVHDRDDNHTIFCVLARPDEAGA